MTTEIEMTAYDADLPEIQEKIIGNKQRILPVMTNDRIVGVITRTDLLNVLVQQTQMTRDGAPDPHRRPVPGRMRNIANFMQERLSSRVLDTLHQIGQTADQLMFQAYVVGGFVRDLFLYRKNEDLDIVIEGDGIAFARTFAEQFNARLHTHKAFGTAVIILKDDFKIDVATARLEYYRSPAALPDVEMGSIKLDLFRRDFTINTLSIYLNPDRFGALIDFFSAQKDIKDKAVRVLHNLSFVEDPTRVFRALRFEQRFGFTIGKLTASLIRNAVKMDFFERLSGRRVFSEIKSILEEDNPTPAVIRMNDFNLLRVIHPSIVLDQALIDLLNATKSTVAWHGLLFTDDPYMRWALYLMALIHHCDEQTSLQVCRKMELAPRYHRMLSRERLDALECLHQMEHRPPKTKSELYHLLHNFRTELVLYMMAATDNQSIKKKISLYYNKLRNIRPSINGQDLIAAGHTPGPMFRRILDAVLDAKINGETATRKDELNYIDQWVQKQQTYNFLDSSQPNQ
jgi:tRNA nucleotidyltransferase (CCA-adding enzyme)